MSQVTAKWEMPRSEIAQRSTKYAKYASELQPQAGRLAHSCTDQPIY